MKTIKVTLFEDDVLVLMRCVKIAKARKKIESNQHLKKMDIDQSNKKLLLVQKLDQLSEYLEYLTK